MKYHHILFILSFLSLNAQLSANFDELTKAILLKDSAKISKLLSQGQVSKDQITDEVVVFAMDNRLSGNTILELALKAGFQANHQFSNGMTLAKFALTNGDIKLVISLMEHGISFYNEQDYGYYHDPIKEFNVPLTKALLKHGYGAKFIVNSYAIRTHCLFYADEHRKLILNDEAFKLLLQAGYNINECFLSGYNQEQSTLLFFMIKYQYLASEIQKIINLGANVNVPCKIYDGYDYQKNTYIYKTITPLALAVRFRKHYFNQEGYSNLDKIIEILVHHGATL